MLTLLSFFSSAFPRALLVAVLWPQTPAESRPWWITACVACETAQLVLTVATDGGVMRSGAMAVLDMLLVAGAYGAWAVIVTFVVPHHLGANLGHQTATRTETIANESMPTYDTHLKAEQAKNARRMTTSSTVSTDLSSHGSVGLGDEVDRAVAGGDDDDDGRIAELQEHITADLHVLNLVCNVDSPYAYDGHQAAHRPPRAQLLTAAHHPTSSSSSYADLGAVPLSPGGWIASMHQLAPPDESAPLVSTQVPDPPVGQWSSSSAVPENPLSRRPMDPDQPLLPRDARSHDLWTQAERASEANLPGPTPSTTSSPASSWTAMLRRSAASSLASLASFASASNLLLGAGSNLESAGSPLTAPGDAGAAADHGAAGNPAEGNRTAGGVHVETEAGLVVVDPCGLPLPPSQSGLLLADDGDDILSKRGAGQLAVPDEYARLKVKNPCHWAAGQDAGSVGELLGSDGSMVLEGCGANASQAGLASGNGGEKNMVQQIGSHADAECQGFQL